MIMKKETNGNFQLHNEFYDSIYDILDDYELTKRGKNNSFYEVASVFDIEASSFYINREKRCCMYAWVFGINGKCIRGRTWEEFEKVINLIARNYETNTKKRFIIYVHNLSYEFQWIKHRFKWYKVFSLEQRKPIYAITNKGIEFRCSYLLSGFSLATLGKNLLKYKVEKMVGDLDYSLIRHTKTPLTEKEWKYILNDGLVVMAHIREEIERLGSITYIPLTKTGYVRKYCREQCLMGPDRFEYQSLMRQLVMDADDYEQMKKTYMGGFTHANYNKVDKIINNVGSYDFTSSYPAAMLSEKYPMSYPIPIEKLDEQSFNEYIKKYCCMFKATFYNIESKVDFEHYISISKCIEPKNYVIDNGRVVEAEQLSIYLTEQDYMIIERMYSWNKIRVSRFKIMKKGYLPKDFILSILKLYRDKTQLKGVEGKESEYAVSKGMLNSCYGMCVTDPCKDETMFDDVSGWYSEKADVGKLLNHYNYSGERFLYYPWGIWITAYARKNLFSGILEFADDYIYSDTDSIKVINIDNHKEYIERYNKRIQEKIHKCLQHYDIKIKECEPKTKEGKTKLLGIWDFEGVYDRFKTLGAKRYIYEQNGDIHITIAGVSKKSGADYLKWKFKTNDEIFRHFKNQLVFPSSYINNDVELPGSGKMCHTYIDDYMCDYVTDYLGNEEIFCEYSGVHLEATEYSMSLDSDFISLLLGRKESYMI